MRDTIDMAETISHGWWLDDEKLKAFAELVRADEREACAKVAEGLEGCAQYFPHVPDIIRKRGNT
jgi:hypothetical protein